MRFSCAACSCRFGGFFFQTGKFGGAVFVEVGGVGVDKGFVFAVADAVGSADAAAVGVERQGGVSAFGHIGVAAVGGGEQGFGR